MKQGKKRGFLQYAAVLALAAGLAGCNWFGSDDDDGSTTAPNDSTPALTKKSWTVMVYLDADNNLEAYGMEDLNEMELGLYLAQQNDADVLDKLNVVVQVDRIAEEYLEYPEDDDTESYDTGGDWTGARRYFVQPDSTRDSAQSDLSSTLRVNLGEVNMGDANELKAFIEWGKEKFPADHYALILWNHGDGVRSRSAADDVRTRAIAYDDSSDGDTMFIGEISDVLGAAHRVDILGMVFPARETFREMKNLPIMDSVG